MDGAIEGRKTRVAGRGSSDILVQVIPRGALLHPIAKSTGSKLERCGDE